MKGYEGRRLGAIQMTTDTAVRVTRMVVEDKGKRMRFTAAMDIWH
jgi:ribosome biogenesis SPOUT family RNA methylase Rps3